MSVLPRVILSAAMLLLALAPPTSQASGCVEVDTASWGNGLRLVASAGRQIAFGVISGQPGDGIGVVVIITPALCGGFGVGTEQVGDGSPTGVLKDLDEAPQYLPLP